jgi:lipase chaperone LimK
MRIKPLDAKGQEICCGDTIHYTSSRYGETEAQVIALKLVKRYIKWDSPPVEAVQLIVMASRNAKYQKAWKGCRYNGVSGVYRTRIDAIEKVHVIE